MVRSPARLVNADVNVDVSLGKTLGLPHLDDGAYAGRGDGGRHYHDKKDLRCRCVQEGEPQVSFLQMRIVPFQIHDEIFLPSLDVIGNATLQTCHTKKPDTVALGFFPVRSSVQ